MTAAIAILLSCLAGPGASDSLRAKVIQAPTREICGNAFKAFFTALSRKALPKLKEDPAVSIALQAAWEMSHRPVRRRDENTGWNWLYDPAKSQEFLTFFQNRTSIAIPHWWAEAILKTEMAPGHGSACFGPPYKGTGRVKVKGNVATILQGSDQLKLPASDIDSRSGWSAVDAELDQDFAYVVTIPLVGTGKLFCFRRNGDLVWKSDVWATGRSALNGFVLESVSVTRNGDSVAVFGRAGSAYAEAFDAATGKCIFRFSTSYWEHWSEAWPWRRNRPT